MGIMKTNPVTDDTIALNSPSIVGLLLGLGAATYSRLVHPPR